MPKQYKIATVEDLCRLPKSKLRQCLRELAACIDTHHALAKSSIGPLQPLSEILWVDDDLKEIRVEVQE